MAQIDYKNVLADFMADIKAKNYSDEEIFKAYPEFNNDKAMLDAAYQYANTVREKKYDERTLQSKFPEFFSTPATDTRNTSETETQQKNPRVKDFPAPTTEEEYQESLRRQEEAHNIAMGIQPQQSQQQSGLTDEDHRSLAMQNDAHRMAMNAESVKQNAGVLQQPIELPKEQTYMDKSMQNAMDYRRTDPHAIAERTIKDADELVSKLESEEAKAAQAPKSDSFFGSIGSNNPYPQGVGMNRDPYIRAARTLLLQAENRMKDEKKGEYNLGDYSKSTIRHLLESQEGIASFGLSNLAQAILLRDVFNKVNSEGAIDNPESVLNEKELALYNAYTSTLAAELARANDTSAAASAGKVTADMIQFMEEMALQSGLWSGLNATLQKTLARKLTEKLVTKASGKAAHALAKTGAGLIMNAAERGVLAGETAVSSLLLPRTYANVLSNQINVANTDKGLSYDGYKMRIGELEEKTDADAFLTAWRDQWKEMYTETGGLLRFGSNIVFKNPLARKAYNAFQKTTIGNILDAFGNKTFAKVAKGVAWDGTFNEWTEEVEGAGWDYLFGDKKAFSNFFSKEQQLPMLISFSLPAIFGVGINAANEGYFKRKYDNAIAGLRTTLENNGYQGSDIDDMIAGIKSNLYVTKVEDIPNTIRQMAGTILGDDAVKARNRFVSRYEELAEKKNLSDLERQEMDALGKFLQNDKTQMLIDCLSQLAGSEVALAQTNPSYEREQNIAIEQARAAERENAAQQQAEQPTEEVAEQPEERPIDIATAEATQAVSDVAFRNGGELADNTPIFRVQMGDKQGYIVSGEEIPVVAQGADGKQAFNTSGQVTVKWDDKSVTQQSLKDLTFVEQSLAADRIAAETEARLNENTAARVAEGEQPILMQDGQGNVQGFFQTDDNNVVQDEEGNNFTLDELNEQGWQAVVGTDEDGQSILAPITDLQQVVAEEEAAPAPAEETTEEQQPIELPSPQAEQTEQAPVAPNIDTMDAEQLGVSMVGFMGDKADAVTFLEAERDKADDEVKRLARLKVTRWRDMYDFRDQQQQIKEARRKAVEKYNKLQNAILAANNYKTPEEIAAEEVTEPDKIVPERPNSKQLQGMNYTVAEAEDLIGRMVRNLLDENGYEGIEIVGTKVIGSRVNGDAREDSDLDAIVEFKGNAREDSLFNLLHDEPIEIDGVKVDINPITEGKSGTIEQFMRRSDEYLAEKAAKEAAESTPQVTQTPREFVADIKKGITFKDKEEEKFFDTLSKDLIADGESPAIAPLDALETLKASFGEEVNDKLLDYVGEHYPTQANISGMTYSLQGRKEREAMKNDAKLAELRAQLNAEADAKDADVQAVIDELRPILTKEGVTAQEVADAWKRTMDMYAKYPNTDKQADKTGLTEQPSITATDIAPAESSEEKTHTTEEGAEPSGNGEADNAPTKENEVSTKEKSILERVAQHEKELGIKINVIRNTDELSSRQRNAKNTIENNKKNGKNVAAWYDKKTGEVYVYLPNIKNANDITKKVFHEIVAHKGLRALIGEENFGKLCDSVWKGMSKEAKAAKIAYVYNLNSWERPEDLRKDNRTFDKLSNAEKAKVISSKNMHRLAADEYMADIAERVSQLAPTDNSEHAIKLRDQWKRICDEVRYYFQKIFNSDVVFTDDDIVDMIAASYANLRQKAQEKQIPMEAESKEQSPLETFRAMVMDKDSDANPQDYLRTLSDEQMDELESQFNEIWIDKVVATGIEASWHAYNLDDRGIREQYPNEWNLLLMRNRISREQSRRYDVNFLEERIAARTPAESEELRRFYELYDAWERSVLSIDGKSSEHYSALEQYISSLPLETINDIYNEAVRLNGEHDIPTKLNDAHRWVTENIDNEKVFDFYYKQQGQITGEAKTPKVNIKDWLAKKKDVRTIMQGVYHDPSGVGVATDAHILLVSPTLYDKSKSGRIVATTGETIEGKYPNWSGVIDGIRRSNTESVTVDWDAIRGFIVGCKERMKEAGNPWRKDSNASIVFRMPNGKIVGYRMHRFIPFAEAAAAAGANEIHYNPISGIFFTEKGNFAALAMPLQSQPFENSYFYDLQNPQADNTTTEKPQEPSVSAETRKNAPARTRTTKRAESEEVAAPKNTEKIGDVGEKIGGARKDIVQDTVDRININGDTFAKIFPKFDFHKLIANGLEPRLAAGLKYICEHAKQSYKVRKRRYGDKNALEATRFLANYAKGYLLGNTSLDFTSEGWVFTNYGKRRYEFTTKLWEKLYEVMGDDMFDVDLSGYDGDIIPTAEELKVEGKKPSTSIYYRQVNGESVEFTPRYNIRTPRGDKMFTEDEYNNAVQFFKESVTEATSYKAANPFELAVYRKRNSDDCCVHAKIGGKWVEITPWGKEYGLRYRDEHRAELQVAAQRKADELKEARKKEHPVAKVELKLIRREDGTYGNQFQVKLGKEYVPIMENIMPVTESYNYLREHREELAAKAQEMLNKYLDEQEENKGWRPQLNIGGIRNRVGTDWRNGTDVTAEQFRKEFGFRGVEFGNYVTQKERQQILNECFDALHDMADILGVSPRALSLNGQLGFAIGARGRSNAAAHYEPQKNVINLTKKQGWGSVAHEWWHALDYYFGKREKERPATGGTYRDDIRQEMQDAFASVMKAINGSEYLKRSQNLDAKTNKHYYAEDTELGARAFEDYIAKQLVERGQVNDFLSHHTAEEDWNGDLSNYPYPIEKDGAYIGDAIKGMFDTIEEHMDDETGNAVLFSASDNKYAQFAIVQANNPMLDDIHTGIRSVEDIHTLEETLKDKGLRSTTPDWKESDIRKAIDNDRVTIFSSKPIKDGTFVTPSRMIAEDYAGGNAVYEKTLAPGDVAWITSLEGQYAPADHLEDDILFAISNANNDYFYSNAERAVEQIKQDKATPEQWKAMIEKQGGLKAGEDKWIGLSDWLVKQHATIEPETNETPLAFAKRLQDANKRFTISKKEILDYIREHKIQIEEQEYGEYEEDALFLERKDEFKRYYDEAVEAGEEDPNEVAWDRMIEEYGDDFSLGYHAVGDELMRDNDSDYAQWEADSEGRPRNINETRLRYTTWGLENKREIALIVPNIEEWNEDDEIHFGDAGGGRAIAWVRFGDTEHTRSTYTDAEGKEHVVEGVEDVLVIDEIQSKRHQSGREQGYQEHIERPGLHVEEYIPSSQNPNIAFARVTDENGILYGQVQRLSDGKYRPHGSNLQPIGWTDYNTEEEAFNIVKKEAETLNEGGVPDAPFEKNWHELAMKRILRFAAENGYDKVAWTTGEQQAKRYDIGKEIDHIVKTDENTYDVYPTSGLMMTLEFDENGMYADEYDREYNGKSMSDIFGKDLAKRLKEMPVDETLQGDGLRVGYDGMKGFYDDILPRFMQKYGKKWGVQVGEVTMPDLEEGYQTMHAIDINDAMRESVMQGQPMFSASPKDTSLDDEVMFSMTVNHNSPYLLKKADGSFVDPETGERLGFDHRFMGRGEGAQSHGWGSYFSRNDIEGYRQESKTYKDEPIAPDPYSDSAAERALFYIEQEGGARNAVKFLRELMREEDDADTRREYQESIDVLLDEKSWGERRGHHYSVEIPDDNGSNYIVEGEKLSSGLAERVSSAIQELQREKANTIEGYNPTEEELKDFGDMVAQQMDGRAAYEYFVRELGSDEAASKKLKEHGIVGIHYDGRRDGECYVIFDEEDAVITNHVMFSAYDNDEQDIEQINKEFNDELQQQIDGTLPQGHVYQLGMPSKLLQDYGIKELPIQLKASRLSDKATKFNHDYELSEVRDLVKAIHNPLAIFKYGDATKAQNVVVEIQHNDKNFIVGISIRPKVGGNVLEINSIRNVFPKDNAEWLNWILQDKALYINKEKIQNLIDQQRTNLADVDYLDLDSLAKVIQNFDNSKFLVKKSAENGDFSQNDALSSAFSVIDEIKGVATDIYNKFQYDGELESIRDVSEYAEDNMPRNEITNPLFDAIDKYRIEEEEDRLYYGERGDLEPFEDAILQEVERLMNLEDETPDEVLFSASDEQLPDENLTRREVVTRAIVRHAKDNYDIMQQAMRRINADIKALQSAAQMQVDVDRNTFTALFHLCNTLLHSGGIWSRYMPNTITAIGTQIRNAIGRKDITPQFNKIMEYVTDAQLQVAKDEWKKLLSTKTSKLNISGVVAQGKVAIQGQYAIDALNEALDSQMTPEQLNEEISKLYDLIDNAPDESQKMQYNGRMIGYEIALQHNERMNDLKQERVQLQNELNACRANKVLKPQARKEQENAITQALLENTLNQAEAYTQSVRDLGGYISEQHSIAKDFIDRVNQRREQIRGYASKDLEGVSSSQHRQHTKQGIARNVWDAISSPIRDMQSLLRMVGLHAVDGEGYLYNHFMRGWTDAADKEFAGLEKAQQTLDNKVNELTNGKFKTWLDVAKYIKDNSHKKLSVNMIDGESYKETAIDAGNALYIYAVNKMSDGRMKLAGMGITIQDVDRLANEVRDMFGQEILDIVDWVQSDYFVNLRNRYNPTHEALFGAPMDAIDNYFPLRINSGSLGRNVDLGDEEADASKLLSGTSTGAIKRRTRNSKPLDVLNADFFTETLRHVAQMERWNAFAQWTRDANMLFSDIDFRNRVKNMDTIYGKGDRLYDYMKSAFKVANGTFRTEGSSANKALSDVVLNLAKGVTSAKINFRVWTALKQIASFPAFLTYMTDANFVKSYLRNIATWHGTMKWAKENLPNFEKRLKKRDLGDMALMRRAGDWQITKEMIEFSQKYGMAANVFFDTLTCATGARAVYDSRLASYIEKGYNKFEAEDRARQDAEQAFNTSQQSSEGAYMSPIQADRNILTAALTVFRTSPIQYTRNFVFHSRNLVKKFGEKETMVKFRMQQYIEDGIDAEKAHKAAEEDFSKAVRADIIGVVVYGALLNILWRLVGQVPYLLFGDDDDKKKELIKKAVTGGAIISPLTGLLGGANIESALDGNGSISGILAPELPLTQDIKRAEKYIENNKYAEFASQALSVLVQSGTGFDPQTAADMISRVVTTMDSQQDLSTAEEATRITQAVLSIPESQYKQTLIDAVIDNRKEYFDALKDYQRYRAIHTAPLTWYMRSDEDAKKVDEASKREFDKLIKERRELKK